MKRYIEGIGLVAPDDPNLQDHDDCPFYSGDVFAKPGKRRSRRVAPK